MKNVSHWIFWWHCLETSCLASSLVGLWLHYRAVKPMAVSETKMANSTAKDSMADSMATPPASTEAPLVPVQISPQRLQSIGVKTGKVERKSVARRDSHHRQCRCGRKATGLRPSAVLRLYPESVCDATYQYVRKGQPLFTVYSPELVATEREYFSGQAESAASGAEYGARCRPQRSIAARRGCGASQAVGRSAKRNHSPRIHRPSAAGTGSRFAGLWLHHRAQCSAQCCRSAGNAPLHHRRPFHSLGSGAGLPERPRTYKDRRSRNAHREYLSGPDVCWPCGLYLTRRWIWDTRTAKVRVVFSNPGLQLKPGMFVT